MASIADLLVEQGRVLANARLRRGERAGAIVSSLGNIPAAIIQDREEERARRAAAARQAAADARAQTETDIHVSEENRRITAEEQARAEEQRGREAIQGWIKQHAAELKPDEVDRLNALAQTHEGVKAIVEHLTTKMPAPYTLNPGDVRFGADNVQVASNPKEPPAVTFQEPKRVTITTPDGKTRTTTARPGSDGKWYIGGVPVEGTVDLYEKPTGGADDASALDDAGLDLAATTWRLTRTLPSRNAKQTGPIMNRAAKQIAALGQTPAAAIQKQAAFAADSKALAKMEGMSSAAEAYETKALAQADLVDSLSSKLTRTDFPLVNGVLQSGRLATGNTDAHLFANALLTFTTEYAKIMSGGTGSAAASTDSAQKEAAKLISTSLSKGTVKETIKQMKWEMRQTMQGYDAVIGHINDRLRGGPESKTDNAKDPLGIR